MKFGIGEIYISKGVANLIKVDDKFINFVRTSFARHINGDWGDISKGDKEENEFSIQNDLRIVSRYNYKDNDIYIITEWDRSATTILFTNEY